MSNPVKETMPDQAAQAAAPRPTQNTQASTDKKSFFKGPVFYVILLLVVACIGYFVWTGVKLGSRQSTSDSAEYTVDLPKDQVTVHLVNDEDIERYPLASITVATLNVYLNTFEGLTVYRDTNKLEPGLAESWTNPDPKTWRVKLRQGVKFQSGDSFTAKDVKYTIDQAKASENDEHPWFVQSWAARVDSVTVIDDYTVDLKTKEPDASLINYLVYVGIVSEAQVKRDGLDKAVGTGPYKLVSVEKKQATLEANTDYWGGAPKVKNLTYKVIPDPATARKELENGNLDLMWVNTPNTNPLGKGFYTSNYSTAGIVYVLLDVNSTSSKKYVSTPQNPFKDTRVRKALLLGLDFPKLIADADINAKPVSQFATQELVGYNPELKLPTRNIEEAKRLLTEAGFPNGFTVTFDVDNHEGHIKIAEGMKKQLADIGIILNINTPETEELYSRLEAGDFSMMYQFYYPDTLDSIDLNDTLFHTQSGSHGSYNVSSYSNPEIDSVINEAASTFDTGKRIDLAHEVHTLVMDNLPSLPLYTEDFQIVARDDVAYNASINMLVQGIELSGRQASK